MIFLYLLIWLFPHTVSDGLKGYWMIWNVGQGQWVTWVEPTKCLHFDMGGEIFLKPLALSLCQKKENSLYLSHWDLDHLNFVSKGTRVFPKFCLTQIPMGRSSRRKEKLLGKLKLCETKQPKKETVTQWRDDSQKKSLSSNDKSSIFVWKGMLLPGDSTKSQENKWIQSNDGQDVRWLILGHHGSRTSTGKKLLESLTHLKMGFASARFKKYGHPHKEVILRMKTKGAALIPTEIWGNIRLEVF